MNQSDERHIDNLIKALASEKVTFKDYSGPEVLALGAAFTWLMSKKKEIQNGGNRPEEKEKEPNTKRPQRTGSKKKASKKVSSGTK